MVDNATLPLDWDAVQESRLWRALTPQQRIWALAFLVNGHDAIAATAQAYHCKSAANTQCLSYEVRKHRDVVAFLEFVQVLTQGLPSREEQVAGVLKTIREAPPYEQVRARRLLALLTGCVESADEPEAEPEKPVQHTSYVGQKVTQRDDQGILHVGEVVAIDAAGHAVEIREVHEGR